MRLPPRRSDDADLIRERLRALLQERRPPGWVPDDDLDPEPVEERGPTATAEDGLPAGVGRHRAPGSAVRLAPGRRAAWSLWVAGLLAALPAVRVLVVDDDSPDGTGALAAEMAAADPRIAVLHHGPRAGLGAAYVDAFTWILAEHDPADVRWVVQMDADGSHAPAELPRLLAGAGGADGSDGSDGADVVLGSRYVPGGRIPDWSAHRRLLSSAGNVYSRWALRLPVRDVTGGYRLFRREVLAAVGLETVASQGYCFQVETTWRAHRLGLRVVEVPITFRDRTRGESKMDAAVVREALVRVLAWRWQELRPSHDKTPSPASLLGGGLASRWS